jgi:HEPN domain-containing protein
MPPELPPENDPRQWFAAATRRRRLAERACQEEGFAPEAVELLQEAAERYLKGYLLTQGWHLVKTHNLDVLIDAAAQYESRFARFTDWAEALTREFLVAHYPTGEDVGGGLEALRRETDAVIKLIRELLPEHFPPPASPEPPA